MNSNTNVVPYIFPVTNQQVRVVMKDDEPWFCLADVCDSVGFENPSQIAKRLDKSGICVINTDSSSGNRPFVYINEPGLYEVILTTRIKPRTDETDIDLANRQGKVKLFKDWVFKEVLPSIRKTGSYGKMPELPKPLGVTEILASLPVLERLGIARPDNIRFNRVLEDFIYNGMIGKSNANDRRWMTCLEIAQLLGYDTYLANKNASQLGKYVSKQIPDGSPNKAKEQRLYKGTEHPTNIYLVDDEVKGHVKRFMDSLQIVSGHLEDDDTGD